LGDGKDWVTDEGEAIVGVVGQIGAREHAEGGHVGKLDKAIRGNRL
jgi:hypothetical protein